MEIYCAYCREEILPHELMDVTQSDECRAHRECWLRIIVGSAPHQLGKCSCGADEECEEDETLTRRESARAAAAVFINQSKKARRSEN